MLLCSESNVTDEPADIGKFKTPSLRNITRTAPYMHIGLFDMDGVLNMYNAGMPALRQKDGKEPDPNFPVKSDRLEPLDLDKAELRALKAFLEALAEPRRTIRPPTLPGRDGSTSGPEERP
jgi:cytochrome c peroxidase